MAYRADRWEASGADEEFFHRGGVCWLSEQIAMWLRVTRAWQGKPFRFEWVAPARWAAVGCHTFAWLQHFVWVFAHSRCGLEFVQKLFQNEMLPA